MPVTACQGCDISEVAEPYRERYRQATEREDLAGWAEPDEGCREDAARNARIPDSAAICALALALPAEVARAQDYPNRTVTIVAPSAAAGCTAFGPPDRRQARAVVWASFVVENRPAPARSPARHRSCDPRRTATR